LKVGLPLRERLTEGGGTIQSRIFVYQSGTTDLRVLAFSFDGRYTEEAIRQKLLKSGLLKEKQQLIKFNRFCSSELALSQ